MRRAWACASALVVLAIACGGFDTDPVAATTPDAGLEASAPETSAPIPIDASMPCDPRAPFVRFEPLRTLNQPDTSEAHATLTSDELRVYFQRANQGATVSVIMTASRTTIDAEFGAPSELTELHAYSLNNFVTAPGVSGDGARLALSVYPRSDPSPLLDIAIVDRLAGSSAFGDAPVPATPLNLATARDQSPAWQADGSRLFFTSSRHQADAGRATQTFFVAVTPAGETIQSPHDVIEAVTGAPLLGFSPAPSADGKTLYFGHIDEQSHIHIYVGDLSADAVITNIGPITTPTGTTFGLPAGDETPSSVSLDQCRVYFTSDPLADNHNDLWVAYRR